MNFRKNSPVFGLKLMGTINRAHHVVARCPPSVLCRPLSPTNISYIWLSSCLNMQGCKIDVSILEKLLMTTRGILKRTAQLSFPAPTDVCGLDADDATEERTCFQCRYSLSRHNSVAV